MSDVTCYKLPSPSALHTNGGLHQYDHGVLPLACFIRYSPGVKNSQRTCCFTWLVMMSEVQTKVLILACFTRYSALRHSTLSLLCADWTDTSAADSARMCSSAAVAFADWDASSALQLAVVRLGWLSCCAVVRLSRWTVASTGR